MARTQGKPDTAAETIEGQFEDDGDYGGDLSGLPDAALATVQRQPLVVRTAYTQAMVVKIPRDMTKVLRNVENEADLAANTFYYSWTQKAWNRETRREEDVVIEGVTIGGAMIMARNFCNSALEVDMVEEGVNHWIFRAVFVDLETGWTFPRLFRQQKGAVKGKHESARKLDIAFAIGQSKALRNVIVNAMPEYMISKAMEKAKEAALRGYGEKLPEFIVKAKIAFAKLGVSQAQLEAKLGKIEARWASTDVRVLDALYRGIRSRETSLENEFPAPEPKAEGAPASAPAATNGSTAAPAPPAPAPASTAPSPIPEPPTTPSEPSKTEAKAAPQPPKAPQVEPSPQPATAAPAKDAARRRRADDDPQEPPPGMRLAFDDEKSPK